METVVNGDVVVGIIVEVVEDGETADKTLVNLHQQFKFPFVYLHSLKCKCIGLNQDSWNFEMSSDIEPGN